MPASVALAVDLGACNAGQPTSTDSDAVCPTWLQVGVLKVAELEIFASNISNSQYS